MAVGAADATALSDHLADTDNPHGVTAAQVGAVPTSRTLTCTAPLTIGGGSSADLSANRTLAMPQATNSVDGYLSATDRAAFAAKQAALTAPGDVPGLTSALGGKSDTGHGHALTDAAITGVLPASKGGLGFDASSLGVSSAEFGYLDGVTSAIQTQLDALVTALGGKQAAATALSNLVALAATIAPGQAIVGDGSGGYEAASVAPASHNHSATAITSGTLDAARLPTGIDAANIGGGAVSSTEFGYLDGVTSGIQTQLDGKQAVDSDLTALAGITVARGTIPVGNSSPAWSGLAKGAAYLPLRMDSAGNDPGYGTLQPQGGGTGLTSYTAGDILYCSATNVLSKLAKGTDGQFLSLASGVPVWVSGGGLNYVDTLFGTSTSTSDTSIATSAALAAGTYLCKFYESHNASGGQCGYKINSGSTIWVLGPSGNFSPGATMALEITVTAGQTLDLRGTNGSGTTSSYGLEIWGPI